ncbi:20087_t:CDS:2 [Gigaspora margarita]|uniref:20087_t:CDS:1 n=1 Tax=Gigaspora margarita TaxID=4874 RepID=A0ABN7ULM1_GIGMA|nr:20087_t:CDS:2 [Gigaspora margarita]
MGKRNGKSALANTLVNTSVTNEFGESGSSTKGKSYRIIDNIGFGDTNNIEIDEILLEVGEGIHAAKEGINQVLFVFQGRFTPKQIAVFNLFKKFIFESKITEYTTIVRTNFGKFTNPEVCENDRKSLLEESKEIREIIESCNGLLYVDNPSIPIIDEDDIVDNYIREVEKNDNISKKEELRKEAVKDIRTHLETEFPEFSKSTLANVMVSNDGIGNNFKESSGSVSETRKIQFEEFEDKENEIKYLVIDTPGINDTKLPDKDILDIIAEAVYLVRNGLSQVFFVTRGRFDQDEMATYDLLRTIIFDQEIAKHTTIVKTKFEDFKKQVKCQKDIEKMVKEAEEKETELRDKIADKEKKIKNMLVDGVKHKELFKEIEKLKRELMATNLAKIIKSCQDKVIHVNNPSLDTDDDDELEDNKDYRNRSKKLILEHLKRTCQESPYKPEKLKNLSDGIIKYMEDKEKKRKELEEKKKKLGLETKKVEAVSNVGSVKQEDKGIKADESIENKSEQISVEDNKFELVFEKGEKEKEKRVSEQGLENNEINFKEITKLNITNLEKEIKELEETKELQEEIQEIEKSIREVVRNHILHNSAEINDVLGGDILIKNITKNDSDVSPDDLDFENLRKRGEECEEKLQKKGAEDQSLEQIENKIKEKEQELLELKKQLLNDEEIFEK